MANGLREAFLPVDLPARYACLTRGGVVGEGVGRSGVLGADMTGCVDYWVKGSVSLGVWESGSL